MPISVTFTLSLLQLLTLSASGVYGLCFLGLLLHNRKQSNTSRPLLQRSYLRAWVHPLIMILCLFRFLTLLSICILQRPNQKNSPYVQYVLLDFPNVMVDSIYALIVLIYIETFLQNRLHTDHISPTRWTVYFLIFPFALALRQILLYVNGAKAVSTNTMFHGIEPIEHYRNVFYGTEIGDCAFGLAFHLFFYLFLNIYFAGHPIRSRESTYSTKPVLIVWGISRIIWLCALVLLYSFRVDILSENQQPIVYPILVFLVFLVCEICPIIISGFRVPCMHTDHDSIPSQIDLSEEDLFWPLDDSVLGLDPRGLPTESMESGESHQLKWIDYIIRNSEAALMDDEVATSTSEDRPLLLYL